MESSDILVDAHINLRTYTGEKLPIIGSVSVTVEYKCQLEELRLLVVEGSGPSLLGRDWLGKLRLDWSKLYSIWSQHSALDNVLAKHQALFKDELGTVRGTTAKIHVAPEVHPRFHKARSVPYACRNSGGQSCADKGATESGSAEVLSSKRSCYSTECEKTGYLLPTSGGGGWGRSYTQAPPTGSQEVCGRAILFLA